MAGLDRNPFPKIIGVWQRNVFCSEASKLTQMLALWAVYFGKLLLHAQWMEPGARPMRGQTKFLSGKPTEKKRFSLDGTYNPLWQYPKKNLFFMMTSLKWIIFLLEASIGTACILWQTRTLEFCLNFSIRTTSAMLLSLFQVLCVGYSFGYSFTCLFAKIPVGV